MCISDMSGWLWDIVPLTLFGCKYNHNLLKYNDYAKKRRAVGVYAYRYAYGVQTENKQKDV